MPVSCADDLNKKRQKQLLKAVDLLKQLAHPVRLSILCMLLHEGEVNVGAIVDGVGGAAGQSQVSQFLAKMRSEGLVKTRREGQVIFYSLSSPEAERVVDALYGIYCGDIA